jgi:hypothetical protein
MVSREVWLPRGNGYTKVKWGFQEIHIFETPKRGARVAAGLSRYPGGYRRSYGVEWPLSPAGWPDGTDAMPPQGEAGWPIV